jgi:hypothetical protein
VVLVLVPAARSAAAAGSTDLAAIGPEPEPALADDEVSEAALGRR